VNEPLATTLADLIARLESRASEARWPAPEAAFAAHVLRPLTAVSRDDALTAELREQAARESDGARWTEAPVLAAAGYLIGDGFADNGLVAHWREGATRLAERDPFPPDRTSFFYRPVELYGLARGAHIVGGEVATWLARVIADGEALVPGDIWHRTLGAAAASNVGRAWSQSLGGAEIDAAGVDELALLAWLVGAEPETATALLGEHAQRGVLDRLLLRRALLERVEAGDAARAALIMAALRTAVEDVLVSAHEARWQLTRTERDAAELVVHLCQRFPRYVRQLGERHGGRAALVIKDEYDVQDHLHALLRLHFDDVREEEWTPSYAGLHARMDFLLKRERTVVETKMTRERLDQRGVLEELIVDKAHYRQHPDCKTLVCFIYDPDRRLKNPDALEGDVSAEEEGLTTRVVVAPRAG
jgi:hypothetical protein